MSPASLECSKPIEPTPPRSNCNSAIRDGINRLDVKKLRAQKIASHPRRQLTPSTSPAPASAMPCTDDQFKYIAGVAPRARCGFQFPACVRKLCNSSRRKFRRFASSSARAANNTTRVSVNLREPSDCAAISSMVRTEATARSGSYSATTARMEGKRDSPPLRGLRTATSTSDHGCCATRFISVGGIVFVQTSCVSHSPRRRPLLRAVLFLW